MAWPNTAYCREAQARRVASHAKTMAARKAVAYGRRYWITSAQAASEYGISPVRAAVILASLPRKTISGQSFFRRGVVAARMALRFEPRSARRWPLDPHAPKVPTPRKNRWGV